MNEKERAVIEAAREFVAKYAIVHFTTDPDVGQVMVRDIAALSNAVRALDRKTWEIHPVELTYEIVSSDGEVVVVPLRSLSALSKALADRICHLLNESEGKP